MMKNLPVAITSAPKVRQFYWCDFPKDARSPEFSKLRPVLILSYRNQLYGSVTVLPCTTKPQGNNPWSYQLSEAVEANKQTYVICDKITTLSTSRLTPIFNRQGKSPIKRLSEAEFAQVLALVYEWLPQR